MKNYAHGPRKTPEFYTARALKVARKWWLILLLLPFSLFKSHVAAACNVWPSEGLQAVTAEFDCYNGRIEVFANDYWYSTVRFLLLKNGTLIATSPSDVIGNYHFDNLDQGLYQVIMEEKTIFGGAVICAETRYITIPGYPPRYTAYKDADQDGYGDPGTSAPFTCFMPVGYVSNYSDCDDSDAHVNPASTEVCNGIDDDCDGSTDEGFNTSDTTFITACFSYTWSETGLTYNTSGTYSHFIPNSVTNSVVCGHTKYLILTIPQSVYIGSVTADNSLLCKGAKANLSANGVSGLNAIVKWYKRPGGAGIKLGMGNVMNNVGIGTYYARVTGDCGVAEDSIKIVGDSIPPVITCPGNIEFTITSGCDKSVATSDPVISDNCFIKSLTWKMSGSTTHQSPSYGIRMLGRKTFNYGSTTVTYTLKDSSNNISTCSFTVKGTDGVVPVFIGLNGDLTDSLQSGCTKELILPAINYSDNCGPVALTWNTYGSTIATGIGQIGTLLFNAGITNVVYTIRDQQGNSKNTSFKVTIYDKIPPTITCPSDTVINTTGNSCTKNFTAPVPVYDDNCKINSLTWAMNGATIRTSITNGIRWVGTKEFNIGTTHVTYSIKDSSGNLNACTFNVIVQTANVCLNTIVAKPNTLREGTSNDLNIKLQPNPTTNAFMIWVLSGNKQATEINIYNYEGRLLKILKVMPDQAITFGEGLPPGTYLFAVRQGQRSIRIKGVKQ